MVEILHLEAKMAGELFPADCIAKEPWDADPGATSKVKTRMASRRNDSGIAATTNKSGSRVAMTGHDSDD